MDTQLGDPVSQLLLLLRKQESFFVHDCAEHDGMYEHDAAVGKLHRRQRLPRRGWTRQDVNRQQLNEYLFEVPGKPGIRSIGNAFQGNRCSTRVATAYRVLPIKKEVDQLFRLAVEFCEENSAFSPDDCKTIRTAVEKHWVWLDAFVHMSDERPMYPETEQEYSESLEALGELSKLTESFSKQTDARQEAAPNRSDTIRSELLYCFRALSRQIRQYGIGDCHQVSLWADRINTAVKECGAIHDIVTYQKPKFGEAIDDLDDRVSVQVFAPQGHNQADYSEPDKVDRTRFLNLSEAEELRETVADYLEEWAMCVFNETSVQGCFQLGNPKVLVRVENPYGRRSVRTGNATVGKPPKVESVAGGGEHDETAQENKYAIRIVQLKALRDQYKSGEQVDKSIENRAKNWLRRDWNKTHAHGKSNWQMTFPEDKQVELTCIKSYLEQKWKNV